MGKFNLTELLNARSQEVAQQEATEQEEQQQEAVQQEKEEVMMIDVCDLVPSKENFYHVDDELKRSIELVGVLQPLLVKKPENGKYRVLAGHRRRLAVLALLNEGKEERRFVPCVYNKEDVRDRLAIIMANRFRDKTDWEKMQEAIEAEELAKELKKEYKLRGRTRAILEEITGVSEAQLGRYKAIYNNLLPELMLEFKENRIGFSVAAEACGLAEEWQLKAYESLEEDGGLSLPDVKKLKEQEENGKGIPGQTKISDLQQETEEDAETVEEDKEAEEEPEEYVDPQPEELISLCYSCEKYEICHDKKATVQSCNAYMDRKKARKTDEQRYSEEQAKLDRETQKKLREQAEKEKMERMPGKEKKKKFVRVTKEVLKEIETEKRPYLILKNTDNFKTGDIIRVQAFENGKTTGEYMDMYITCADDEDTTAAIETGYVIAGVVHVAVAYDLGWIEE
jgi:ParB-like chromosome segregation protein Spo0J